MIVTQTPLRISLLGGGTDFREYYLREEGCVLSSAIDKHVYVIIKDRYDDRIRVGYTRTELVECVDELEHDLVRECLRRSGITKGVELSTMADIPSAGSGLGSSSSVTVGLLCAMYAYLSTPVDAETLAKAACEVEIDVLKKPIGVQDQYIAAYGGQRFIRFNRDGRINVESLGIHECESRKLNQNLMLFFTGLTRKSETVLGEQVQNIDRRLDVLREMKRLAVEGRAYLCNGDVEKLGHLLHVGWTLKKQMASRITNGSIDEIYDAARRAGAIGGKVTGAGGGGYLLLFCPAARQDDVRYALRGLSELPFNLGRDGSKVIFNCRQ